MIAHDDNTVRVKAVDSLIKVSMCISDDVVKTQYLSLVNQLGLGDFFAMRISASALYAAVYQRLDGESKSFVLDKFKTLAEDDTPMVRRGAA